MKLSIWCPSGEEAGMGHVVRARAFADEADNLEHEAILWIGEIGKTGMLARLDRMAPDWLCVDAQDRDIGWAVEAAGRAGAKLCNLAALGDGEDDRRPNLSVVQGLVGDGVDLGNNFVSGIEFIILRQELFTYQRWPSESWFVFGGYNDPLGLLEKFMKTCPNWKANLIVGNEDRWTRKTIPPAHFAVHRAGDLIFRYMASAKAACVSLGFNCWELAALGVPTYAFSLDETEHLVFAKRMEALGILKAWPETGLPDTKTFRAFLSEPFKPSGLRPDKHAASRILRLMEARL